MFITDALGAWIVHFIYDVSFGFFVGSRDPLVKIDGTMLVKGSTQAGWRIQLFPVHMGGTIYLGSARNAKKESTIESLTGL